MKTFIPKPRDKNETHKDKYHQFLRQMEVEETNETKEKIRRDVFRKLDLDEKVGNSPETVTGRNGL